MGAGWLPGVPPSIPFWSTFAPPTEDSCQFQKPLESTWLLPIGCFMIEEIDQPIECVQTHFMLFFVF
jgi:hypothetical protein